MVTTEPTVETAATAPARPRLGPHLLALALVLGGLWALSPATRPWTSDDGAYAHAVFLLDEGSWSETRPDLDLLADPTEYPLANAEVDAEGRAFPYVRHPLWVVLLRATSGILGAQVGFLVVNVAAMLATAAVAWALARRWGSDRPALALWTTATAPVLVSTFALWAHAPAAALGGAAVLALDRLARRRSPVAAVGLGLALAGLALVRTEGVLFAGAALLGLAVVCWRRAGGWSRAVDLVVAGGLVGLAVVGERLLIGAIAGSGRASTGPEQVASSWLAGRVSSAWRTIGSSAGGQAGVGVELVGVLAVAALVAGLVLLARGDRPDRVRVLLVAGVALVALRWAAGPRTLVPGLLPAWPAMVAGLVCWALAARRSDPVERLVVGVGGGFLIALLTVQYVAGGGIEWGARYLAPLTVPLAVLAARGFDRAAPDPARRRPLAIAVVGVGVLLVAQGLVGTTLLRGSNHDRIVAARAAEADVVVPLSAFTPRLDLDPDSPIVWRRPGREGPTAAVAAALADGAVRVAVVGVGADQVEAPEGDVETLRISPTVVVFHPS